MVETEKKKKTSKAKALEFPLTPAEKKNIEEEIKKMDMSKGVVVETNEEETDEVIDTQYMGWSKDLKENLEKVKPLDEKIIIREFENLFPSPEEMIMVDDLAKIILNSKLFTKFKTVDEIKVILFKARALKLDPLHGLAKINVFLGNVTASAELQLYLVLRSFPNALKSFTLTDTACGIVLHRPGMAPVPFKFTLEDAYNAKLCVWNPDKKQIMQWKTNGEQYFGTWGKFTKDLLRSRTVSHGCRSLFPDVLGGLSYTPEDFDIHLEG